ncbi:MAG: response regulator transcription factor [Ignavibacteriaceae bacterium]
MEKKSLANESFNNEKINIAIVDDDAEIRRSLCWIINQSPKFFCSATWKNCGEALKNIETDPPDVILMDIGLPDKSGIECVKIIKDLYPGIQILMLTVYSDEEKIFQSIRSGAVGYILKNISSEKLLEAIGDAYGGGAPMSSEIARKVLNYFRQPKDDNITAKLSSREIEVLEALIEGHTYKAIADKLFLSVHTVRFHLHNIYGKLHVKSRAEAVKKAIKGNFTF